MLPRSEPWPTSERRSRESLHQPSRALRVITLLLTGVLPNVIPDWGEKPRLMVITLFSLIKNYPPESVSEVVMNDLEPIANFFLPVLLHPQLCLWTWLQLCVFLWQWCLTTNIWPTMACSLKSRPSACEASSNSPWRKPPAGSVHLTGSQTGPLFICNSSRQKKEFEIHFTTYLVGIWLSLTCFI